MNSALTSLQTAVQAAYEQLTAGNTASTPVPPAGVVTLAGQLGEPVSPPLPPPPVQSVDSRQKGYHLDVTIAPEQVVAAAQIADQFGFGMDTITGVDWLPAGQMEVVYDFFHPHSTMHLVVRTRVARDAAAVPTIQGVFPGANWHERETHDFFGIKFLGHPDLTPLLLPEDANYHPLRKDFAGAT